MYKKAFALLVLAITFMILGCGHKPTPFLPLKASKVHIASKNLEDKKGRAGIQVFIMYSSAFCSHTALRLYHPDKGALFWDPAGGYGIEGKTYVKREKDIILTDTPTINDYIRFRTEIPTKTMEIFEWEISLDTADQFYSVLLNGTDKFHPNGRFSTKGKGLFCGAHVSDFLERFGSDLFQVKKVFFPHDLSKQLYKNRPYRIIIVDVWKTVDIREIHQNKDFVIKSSGN